MSGIRPADVLRHLDHPGTTDAALITRYCFHNDEAAVAEVVRRHGPVVWAACRRVAGNSADAEDAFQATFLVLVRRAAAIKNLDLLGNWLYGVAVRVAMKARRSAARRRRREVQVPTMPDPPDLRGHTPPGSPELGDLGPVIDAELAGLPAYYREAVVLCDLRGVSRPEAARLLGIPEGTLSSRLAAGRKRLAARLAKRGVTLAAVAVPPVLANIARAAVPPELAARVTLQATTGAVPPAVVRLANEGFSVKTTLLMTVVLGSAIAGVVYAAGSNDLPPQPDPPKPPAVVAKADPAPDPQPKPDPKAKDGDGPGFTTRPRVLRAIPVPLSEAGPVVWSPDGKVIAVQGTAAPVTKDDKPRRVIRVLRDLFEPLPDPDPRLPSRLQDGPQIASLGPARGLVGFTPDNALITDTRERGLITGIHRLEFWGPRKAAGGAPDFVRNQLALERTVNLEAEDTSGYYFAPDGKTFRTLTYERLAATGPATRFDVQEVDAAMGKTLKSVFKVDSNSQLDYFPRPLSPDGKRLVLMEPSGKVVVYDVDRGARLSEHALPEPPALPKGAFGVAGRPTNYLSDQSLTFSPDGKRLVVSRGLGQTVVLNTDTGEALPALEGADLSHTEAGPSAFTGDGRLLALTGTRYAATKNTFGKAAERGQTVYIPAGDFLTVWDTQTGKVLKSWPRRGVTVAFNPKRPLLAILEPNGEETRLGLWDFAAEAGKK